MTAPTPHNRPASATRRHALPLARSLPLLTLGIVAVLAAVSLTATYYEIRRSAEMAASDHLLTIVRRTAALSEPTNRYNLLRRVARDTAVENALRNPTRGSTADAVKAMAPLMPRVGGLDSSPPPQLWTPAGQPIGAPALESPSDAEKLRGVLSTLTGSSDSARIGTFFQTGGHTAVWYAAPVRAGDALLGYVAQERVVAVNPAALGTIQDFAGRDLAIYLRNVGSPLWIKLTGSAEPAPAGVPVDSLASYKRAGLGDVLSATAPIVGTPIYVTAELPMSTILDRPRQVIRFLASIGIALAILGALVAWLFARRMVQPLGEVTSAAEALARGDYSRRVRGEGAPAPEEAGRLATAFNQMAAQVEASHDSSEQAVARLTESSARQEFLAEASRLLATSLSDESIIADLARYCVPKLADYCTIHVVDDSGAIRRIETAHADPSKQAAVRALVERYPYRVDGPGEVPNVVRTRQPTLIPELPLDAVKAAAPDDVSRRLLDDVRPASFLCVPLEARGRAFGAISFTMTDSGRRFSESDLDLATELARRTAVAIDNAVIYRASLSLRLEAEAASRSKSDFLAKMSHEIRTPINAMMGYAELLEMGIGGSVTELQAKHLARIRASGEHLTSLVNEILDLAKIEAGRMDIEPIVAPAGEAIDVALTLIRPQAIARGVEIAARPAGGGDFHYVGDPQRVQQILTNLLSNAVKFTPTGGSVSVVHGRGRRPEAEHGEGPDGWTCFSILDTGVGIDAGDLDRIFQPFVQVDGGYTRAHGGTGLGLTISRTLAQMMGGEITVESAPGMGSRFTLWLPAPA